MSYLLQNVEHSRGEVLRELKTGDTTADVRDNYRKKNKSFRKLQRKAMRYRFAGFSTLTGSMATSFSWNAQVALTGSAYNPSINSSSINKRQAFGTEQGTNTQSGGCDECFSFQQGVTAGASVTLDLLAMTDLLQRANVTIARIKGCQFRVLSATDDPTISPAPTSTSVGVVTNTGVTLPSPMDFQANGSGLTVDLTTSAGAITAIAIGAAGSGYPKSSFFLAAPRQASGSGNVFLVTTNGSGVPSAVTFISGTGGTGYTNASGVPTFLVGQYAILTGGAHMYFDPSATGFCLVSSTSKNLKLVNTDASNAITFEVDFFAGSD